MRMLNERRFLIGLLLVFVLMWGAGPSIAEACPTCKDGVAAQGSGLAEGFYWSILFMLGMPFSLASGWAFFIWRSLRRGAAVANPAVSVSLPS